MAAGVVEAFEDDPGSDGLLGDELEAGEEASATGRLELDDVDGWAWLAEARPPRLLMTLLGSTRSSRSNRLLWEARESPS